MRIDIVKFKADHLDRLQEQPAMAYLSAYASKDYVRDLERNAGSFTALAIEHDVERVICCGGIIELTTGRGEAWALVDRNCKREFPLLHAAAKKFLDGYPLQRIEAVVDAGFRAGHRWVKALGFQLEAEEMRKYRPSGKSASLYARVK